MADIPSRKSTIIAERFTVIGNTFKRAIKSNPKDRIEIEIGDSKQPDFKPQAKISRWDNEVNFSLRAQEHPEAIVRTEGKLIKYVTPDYEVHQYELDPGEIGEDGGLEFEWVLPQKPASNVLTATIQTKELNFLYQPALTQEEIDEGSERPENVVGSYAVYHKTKGGMNRADGMEYKTGKAFHIYRPKVTDKKGEETWAELNIDEQAGVLSVTVPQEFLDKAVYPVIVDPTFGYTSIGSTTQNIATYSAPNRFITRVGTAFSGPTGTLDSVSAVMYQFVDDGNDVTSIFVNTENTGTNSHNQVATVEAGAIVNGTAQFNTYNCSSEALDGSTYILSMIGRPQVMSTRYDSTGSNRYYNETKSSTSIVTAYNAAKESPWTRSAAITGRNYSIYATYVALATSDIKKLSSIAQASLKKVSSIAEASVKKVSGVANV